MRIYRRPLLLLLLLLLRLRDTTPWHSHMSLSVLATRGGDGVKIREEGKKRRGDGESEIAQSKPE